MNPDWLAKPTFRDLAHFYPERAERINLDGRATLACRVNAEGGLEHCRVVAQSPTGYGFGDAALAMAPLFRMTPMLRDGKPVRGARIRIPVTFAFPKPGERPSPPPK